MIVYQQAARIGTRQRSGSEAGSLDFAPFAMPGGGAAVLPGSGASPTGQMLRMQEVIARDGPNHKPKDQFFILADGSGCKWLAHRYDYLRQR